MKYAVSNIAWSPEQRLRAYALLRDTGFTGLEIAPALFLPDVLDPFDPPKGIVDAAVGEVSDFGLRLVSMQSLLFGRSGAKLFGDADERRAFVAGIEAAISLANQLEIPNLVFGSPAQRVVPPGLDPEHALDDAAAVFERLARMARSAGTVIAMEPNAAAYGTNFLNTLTETAAFVRRVGHPSLRLNLDVGALMMNSEMKAFRFSCIAELISHVHVSAPMLGPAPSGASMARQVHEKICRHWNGWLSIEMKAVEHDPGLDSLGQCMKRLIAGEDPST